MENAMPPESSTQRAAPAARRPPRRVVFDRRYGWIVDEWMDPCEEALAGGRGMFCILPIAKALVKVASQSIDYASQCVVKIIEDPEKFSPQSLKANMDIQFQSLQNSVQRSSFKLLLPQADSTMVQSHSPDFKSLD